MVHGTMIGPRHLRIDLDFHQRKLEEYAKQHQDLEDTNRRLASELEYKTQELLVVQAVAFGGKASSVLFRWLLARSLSAYMLF